jgi:isoquinoline 1-oxidoreductase subunit alpha
MPTILLNGTRLMFDVSPDMPLLWAIRDIANLTGTKYGCGAGLCGACTVHVNGEAVRSCQTPIGSVDGAEVTTIEGLSKDRSHPVQKAWIELQVPQCGYCQTGMIMAAAAFLEANPKPRAADVAQGVTNLCRCGTYPRIKKAVLRAAELRDEELEQAAEAAKAQVRAEKKAARQAAKVPDGKSR